MNCEKCKTGGMVATKIPKFSGCLVAIGYTLLIPSILALLAVTAVALLGVFATGSATVEGVNRAKGSAIEQLNEIPDLPPEVVADFEDDGVIDDSVKANLTEDQQRRVDSVVSMYGASIAGTALGGTMAAGIGTAMVVTVYMICIPAFIVGLVLLLKRSVWRCRKCGYVFERA